MQVLAPAGEIKTTKVIQGIELIGPFVIAEKAKKEGLKIIEHPFLTIWNDIKPIQR
ncbi:hypothetical protein [Candidatus Hydrogenosomobacter endosymbioticus]|uniref:hypothetical protein n=1 Tax=Candidatus Hydrogenosomobacter endosymbioticus TaxID=2558174 RepID=UPI001F20A254|nr:hypothetical protein [Candidatus Hydrogenosomobacter endosymbioticus]